MKYETFIAKRYLGSKHKVNFITIISFLSIAGITIGVAALIVVLSVFNGFGSLVTSYLINFDPHLRIEIISDQIEDETEIQSVFSRINEIKYYSPFVSGKVLAMRSNLYQVVNLKGIVEDQQNIYNIKSNIIYGEYDIGTDSDIPKIVLGLRLADKLQAMIGDTIIIVSPAFIERAITQFSMPNTDRFILTGIYNSNNNEYDASYIFSSIESSRHLLGYSNRIQGYDIMLDDLDNAFEIKDRLDAELNPVYYSVNTWYDFHRDLYSVMQIERWAAYILLSLIIAVATFNILGSLSMSVIEKKRDIGILRSMGAVENSILKIFMYEGLLIGLIGTLAGAILGYLICWIQLEFNIYSLDPAQFKIDSLPLEVRFSDFFFIAGMSLFLTFLASLFPAKRAAKVDPLEAIKWE
jgi:lipoprotein-releasing system permease protein